MREARQGGALMAVVLLLGLIVAAGGFNYWRNLQAEDQSPRPYAGYSDSELEALIAAYRVDVETLDARYVAARDRRSVKQVARGAHISDHVRGFEQARAAGDVVRKASADAAQQGAVLRDLERERADRRVRAGLDIHIRRLTTL